MIKLYLLTKNNTIKFGMSIRLEYRWIDSLAEFDDSLYINIFYENTIKFKEK